MMCRRLGTRPCICLGDLALPVVNALLQLVTRPYAATAFQSDP